MLSWWKEPVVALPCNTYIGKNESLEIYYTENEMLKKRKKYMNPGTRYHDANSLFMYLIDYCIENDISNNDKTPIINSSMKCHFLKYVYEISAK